MYFCRLIIKKTTHIIGKFALNIGFIVILNLLIKPIGLLIEMKVQDKIGHEAFGKYAALYSLGYLFMIGTDLGINQYITKSLAEKPTVLKELFPTAFGFKLISLIFFPVLMIGIGLLLGYELTDLYFLVILSIAHALIQLIGFFRANFQGFQYFSIDAISSNIDKVLLIIFIAILLYSEISLESFVWARFLSLFCTTLILGILMQKYGLLSLPSWKWKTIQPIIVKSIPFAFMTILYSINEKVDQVMVERIDFIGSTINQAGIYAASYRWLDAMMMYLWTILPMFFAKFAYHESTQEDKERLLKIGTGITAIPLLLVAGFSLFYGEKFFFIYQNSSVQEIDVMVELFQVLCFALCIHGFFAILSTYLTSNGHTKFVNSMLGVNIILNMVLNFLFIPSYGALAAAYSTVISTLIMSISYVIYIQKKQLITLPYLVWLKLILVFCIYIATYYKINELFSIHWLVNTSISTLIAITTSLLFKIITIQELKKLK